MKLKGFDRRGGAEILVAVAFVIVAGIMSYLALLSTKYQIDDRVRIINTREGFYLGELLVIRNYLDQQDGALFPCPSTTPLEECRITPADLSAGSYANYGTPFFKNAGR